MKLRRMMILLAGLVLAFGMSTSAVMAESTTLIGEAHFNGKAISSTFADGEMEKAVSDLQPGDEVTFKVKYQNDYEKSTDWYMTNEVIQTLEKADAARKVLEGTGTPENGGYTYKLIHKDKNGKKTVLFSNAKVGGEAKPANMQGLEQATNALDDWFFIQTLKQGEYGELTLNIAFEGETEVNDYMDTDGGVSLRFAVELTKPAGKSDKPDFEQVKTGDDFPLWPFIVMFAAGLAMLILFLARRRQHEGEEGGEA